MVSKPVNVKVRAAKPYKAISLHVRHRACLLSHFGHVRLFATPWTIACQAPLSMEFSRQEYWGGLPCPPPGGLPNPRIKPASHVCHVGRWVLYHSRHLGSPLGTALGSSCAFYSVHPCISPVTVTRLRLREVSTLLTITQQGSYRTGIHTQATGLQRPCSKMIPIAP